MIGYCNIGTSNTFPWVLYIFIIESKFFNYVRCLNIHICQSFKSYFKYLVYAKFYLRTGIRGSIIPIVIDLSDFDSIHKCAKTFKSQEKALHYLVLNGGVLNKSIGYLQFEYRI